MNDFNQMNIFDIGKEPLKITKPIRLIELFAGIGAQAKSLERLGVNFEHYRVCEFDSYAITNYNAIHGTNFEPSDITKWKGDDLGIIDTDKYTYVLTYSFPCFVGDSMVLTDKGYKKIVDIEIGDFVLTHDNTYQKVINKFDNGKHQVYSIKGMAIDEIKATGNHKFYTRKMYRKGHYSIRTFEEPKWKELKELTKNDYLGIAINQNSIIPKWNGVDFIWKDGRKPRHKNELEKYMNNKDFWWIVGRYIGDGWQRPQGGVVICCNKNEKREIEKKLKNLFNYCCIEDRTVMKFHIPLKELQEFVKQFGSGAKNKTITNTVIDLPCDLLESFIQGYFSADGSYNKGLYQATSISRELIYGIGQCVAKVYKTPYRIYKTKRPKTYKIEGRTVNQNDTYQIAFKIEKRKQDKAFYENGYIWYPIKSIEKLDIQNVYDIEVEKNHSFTVQNTIVHNCQSLSIAGNQEGMAENSGTKSSLLWEVKRLLVETENLPQILILENVPQIVSKKNIQEFNRWVEFLKNLGYTSNWQILNSKHYKVPQNRDRCFMVSWLGDYSYDFPQRQPLKKVLRDILQDESEIDDKYYLSEKGINYVFKREGKYTQILDKNSTIAPSAITAVGNANWTGNFVKCEPVLVGGYGEKKSNGGTQWYQQDRVYSADTIAMSHCASITGGSYSYYVGDDLVTSSCSHNGSGTFLIKKPKSPIRKLTQKECFRLMDFDDDDYEKARKALNDKFYKGKDRSGSQLYRQAGNSICVCVLEAIFKKMM